MLEKDDDEESDSTFIERPTIMKWTMNKDIFFLFVCFCFKKKEGSLDCLDWKEEEIEIGKEKKKEK